jgi:hypothetical protein
MDYSYSVLRALLHMQSGRPGMLRWERQASFWIADTWHVIELLWWLAQNFSQVNTVEILQRRSLPSSMALTMKPVQSRASARTVPQKTVNDKPLKMQCFKQTHSCYSHHIERMSFKVFDNLTHPCMGEQLLMLDLNGRHCHKILTASVNKIRGRLTALRLSKETNAAYARRHT